MRAEVVPYLLFYPSPVFVPIIRDNCRRSDRRSPTSVATPSEGNREQ